MTNPDAELYEGPMGAVLAIMRMSRALEHVDAGLSPQQYRILKLAGAGGERSARIAERLAVAKPTLTAIADSLVAAGLAQRQAEAGDRRVVRLCLTPAGHAAVQHADAVYALWLSRLLEETGAAVRIQDDLKLLNTALDELHRAQRPLAGARRDRRAGEGGGEQSVSAPGPVAAEPGSAAEPAAARGGRR